MTQSDKEPVVRKRRWSWLWAALAVSLSLNLAVVAAVLTHESRGYGRHSRITGPSFTQVLPRAFFRGLDKQRRIELMADFRPHRGEYRQLRQQLRELGRELATALRAEPYDAGAVDMAMANYEAGSRQMLAKGRSIAVNFFARLTPQERKLMADQIERKTMSHRQWRARQSERDD